MGRGNVVTLTWIPTPTSEVGAGSVAPIVDFAHVRKADGDLLLSATDGAWEDVDPSLDLVVEAEPGDLVEVALSSVWEGETNWNLDVVTVVAGSPVTAFASGNADRQPGGVSCWTYAAPDPKEYAPVSGSTALVVGGDDVVGGLVTLRLQHRAATAVGEVTLTADSGRSLHLWAKTYRAPDRVYSDGGDLTTVHDTYSDGGTPATVHTEYSDGGAP